MYYSHIMSELASIIVRHSIKFILQNAIQNAFKLKKANMGQMNIIKDIHWDKVY